MYKAILKTEEGKLLTISDNLCSLDFSQDPGKTGPYIYPVKNIRPNNYPQLKKGVNISDWYENSGCSLITTTDLDMIKAAGFDHVRFAITPGYILDHQNIERGFGWDYTNQAGTPLFINRVKEEVDKIINSGLECILDFHSISKPPIDFCYEPSFYLDSNYTNLYYTDPAVKKNLELKAKPYQDSLINCWKKIATVFKDYPQNKIAYELINEPGFFDFKENWIELRNNLIKGIKEIDDEHLIIVPFRKGDSYIDGFNDSWIIPYVGNYGIAYTVHYYEPYFLTHILAEYLGINFTPNLIKNLTYPPLNDNCYEYNELYKADYVSDASFQNKLNEIGYQGKVIAEAYNYFNNYKTDGKLINEIRRIGEYNYFEELKEVRILVTEFGPTRTRWLPKFIYDPEKRLEVGLEEFRQGEWIMSWTQGTNRIEDSVSVNNYIMKIRKEFEKNNIGWCIWDYCGRYAIADTKGDVLNSYTYMYPNPEGNWYREFKPGTINALFS